MNWLANSDPTSLGGMHRFRFRKDSNSLYHARQSRGPVFILAPASHPHNENRFLNVFIGAKIRIFWAVV